MKNQNIESGKYTAKQDLNIKYVYSLGGGIKGRTIKAGDVVTVIGVMNDIDDQSVSCLELLNRITIGSFVKFFIKVD